MMTDLDNFIELYKGFGIELKPDKQEDGSYKIEMGFPEFEGYAGFFSEVKFDENKKFVSQGFWE